MKKTILLLFLLAVILTCLNAVSAASTERASLSDPQASSYIANGNSYNPCMTPDGRYIAFESQASNLVDDDTNGASDIFVRDTTTGVTTRVSTTATGGQANGNSYDPSITPNGRYIAFMSSASNLVSGDTNSASDIFVKDGWTGQINRVSTTATGAQATGGNSYSPSISSDGRYIAFESDASNLVNGDTNSCRDVFVKDGWTGAITRVSTTSTGGQATGGNSYIPVITPDGRYIVFESYATNLVTGDTNVLADIFVKDRTNGIITRVSTTATGGQANGQSYTPSITPDGRYIAFKSFANNLVNGDTNNREDIFVKDGWTGQITRVSTTSGGGEANGHSIMPKITSDGRYVVFGSEATNLVGGDTNNFFDIFVKDTRTGQITRVSTTSSGGQANGDSYEASISSDGRCISFYSYASNLVTGDSGMSDLFKKDGWTGAISRVSAAIIGLEGNNANYDPSITPDGRYVVFQSAANNLVAGDTNLALDIFVHDMNTHKTVRVSTSASGAQANNHSWNPKITPDGRYIVFESDASNLVNGDTNDKSDIFVKDGWTGQITRLSTSTTGGQSNGASYDPVITPDGRYVVFDSLATNLINGDTNGYSDVFVKDGWTGQITRVSTTSTGGQTSGSGSYNPSITPDGRYIAFQSGATNLVSGDTNGYADIFVKDGWTGTITRVSTTSTGGQATGGNSWYASITPDGRYVVFESEATNLVSGDTSIWTDIFVKDVRTGQITRVSTSATGGQANADSYNPSITPDGRYITFESRASNLVGGDTADNMDVFVKDGWTGNIQRVSYSVTGGQANGWSYGPSITSDGKYVAFCSDASNILLGDFNSEMDIFVRAIGWGTIL